MQVLKVSVWFLTVGPALLPPAAMWENCSYISAWNTSGHLLGLGCPARLSNLLQLSEMTMKTSKHRVFLQLVKAGDYLLIDNSKTVNFPPNPTVALHNYRCGQKDKHTDIPNVCGVWIWGWLVCILKKFPLSGLKMSAQMTLRQHQQTHQWFSNGVPHQQH